MGDEDGFTLIEVLVTVMLLVVGITAMIGVLDVSRRLTSVAERQTSMVHRAQQELERVRALPYAQVALKATPATSIDPTNPDFYVQPGSPGSLQWDRLAAGTEPLAVDATNGQIPATGTAWTDGRLSGYIYAFVTWHTDPNCGTGCPATSDYKRITVAVTVTGSSRPRLPALVSTLMVDASAQPAGFVGPGQNPLQNPSTQCLDGQGQLADCTNGLGTGNANTWFLYDTGASFTVRQPIIALHATHPTVAVTGPLCATLGVGCPQPDLMGSTPPPSPQTVPPLYSYSSDIAGVVYTGGRLLHRDTNCANPPTTTDNTKGAFWTTNQLAATTRLTGDGGMTVYTQTANGVAATVTLCVAFYDAPPSILNLITLPPVQLGVVAYTAVSWPTTPTPLSFTFDFRGASGLATVVAGNRIGLRVWIAASAGADVALIYDHPSYASQVQLNSQ